MSLREEIAKKQSELTQAEIELSELAARFAALPKEYELSDELERPLWRVALLALLPVVLAAGALALHHASLTTRARDDGIDLEQAREQAKRCQVAVAEARAIREDLRRRRDAAPYAGVRPSPHARNTYPGLEEVDELRRLPPDDGDLLLRWVNIGVAACTVGERPVADWALDALSARLGGSTSYDDRRVVGRAQTAMLVRCMLQERRKKTD